MLPPNQRILTHQLLQKGVYDHNFDGFEQIPDIQAFIDSMMARSAGRFRSSKFAP
jgi:hypothetical protein